MVGKYTTPAEYFFRCIFPRGRILTELEDELSRFVKIIVENAGKDKESFDKAFDQSYKTLVDQPLLKDKTIHNIRTETISLLGLVVLNDEGKVEPTKRTQVLYETQDYRMFFKSFCDKFQFPNGINKPQEVERQIKSSVRFKPARFILQLFRFGIEKYGPDFSATGPEISNLVFNDLRVSSGNSSPQEVLQRLEEARKNSIEFEGNSFHTQHGREFLGYMTLAGLLRSDGHGFKLNDKEGTAIKCILQNEYFFPIPNDYQSSLEVRKAFEAGWEKWFGEMTDEEIISFKTPEEVYKEAVEKLEEAISIPANIKANEKKETGEIGEKLVLRYERGKIQEIRPDKVPLVQLVSSNTTLGYDIISLQFQDVSLKKQVEVKTTKRTFAPESGITVPFPISSNEWNAAKTYRTSYFIYRVILSENSAQILIVRDPVGKEETHHLIAEPNEYKIILSNNCVDDTVELARTV